MSDVMKYRAVCVVKRAIENNRSIPELFANFCAHQHLKTSIKEYIEIYKKAYKNSL